MPIESKLLEGTLPPFRRCPKCGAEPFDPFLRGQVQRGACGMRLKKTFPWIEFYEQPYCAVICWKCKEIVGYE
jgi:predicted nucleic-acid-binding Zn-ribbon protein